MNRLILTIVIVLSAASAWANEIVPASEPIQDQYIVVLKQDAIIPPGLLRAAERRHQARSQIESLAAEYRGRTHHVFTDTIPGFSAAMTRREARALARDPRVAYVAQDGWVQAAEAQFQADPPSWGLDRIDQRDNLLDGLYEYITGEHPVSVYVIDSGIRTTHSDFAGRVDTMNAFTAYTDGWGIEDCHGHGTHVAGVIGGTLHGVAKNVTLHPVRVLNCWAGGPISAVIAGVDWVTAQVNDNPHAAVANMSLSAAGSQALDDAVRASIAAGVTYVIAAGNNGADACNYSPARVEVALTVGSSTSNDNRSLSSNYGRCVDLYAPGVSIVSAFNRHDEDSLTMSGTSMAAPHVAGIAAKLLAQNPAASPTEIADLIIANATQSEGDFTPDGNDLIAYSMIQLENHENSDSEIEVGFQVACTNNHRCVFQAEVEAADASVNRYYWDYGDGNTHDHHRPTARHRYQTDDDVVTVILAVEFDDGGIAISERAISLPSGGGNNGGGNNGGGNNGGGNNGGGNNGGGNNGGGN